MHTNQDLKLLNLLYVSVPTSFEKNHEISYNLLFVNSLLVNIADAEFPSNTSSVRFVSECKYILRNVSLYLINTNTSRHDLFLLLRAGTVEPKDIVRWTDTFLHALML